MDFEHVGNQRVKLLFAQVWERLDGMLSGDAAQDMRILQHHLDIAGEICTTPDDLRAAVIGVMMGYHYDGVPEQFSEMTEFVVHRAGQEMAMAKQSADQGQFNDAMQRMTRLMSRINVLFRRFSKSTIFDFRDAFDAFVYSSANFSEHAVYQTPFEVSRGHQFIGKLYLKLGDIDRGISALRCAVAWNPACASHYLDLAAAYYQKNEFSMHALNASLAYRYLRAPEDYRRFYFETARRYDHEGDHKFAAELYKLSLAFGDNARARGALSNIEQNWFKCATPPLSYAHLTSSCRSHGTSFGPSPDMMHDIDEFLAGNSDESIAKVIEAEKASVLDVWNGIG